MKRYWAHFKNLLKHKYCVYIAGRKRGLGVVRLVLHDWDKFGPRMFIAYARNFYGPKEDFPSSTSESYRRARVAGVWLYTREEVEKDFDYTWNRHQKVSKHHWQHWVLMEDDGNICPLEVPYYDMVEMLSDWEGARAAYNSEESMIDWYQRTAHARKLHPATQAWIEAEIGIARPIAEMDT